MDVNENKLFWTLAFGYVNFDLSHTKKLPNDIYCPRNDLINNIIVPENIVINDIIVPEIIVINNIIVGDRTD